MNNAKHEETLRLTIKDIYENDLGSMDYYKDIQYVDFDFGKHASFKRPKYTKHIAIAASLFLIVLLSGAFGIILSNGSVSATGFEIEKQLVKLQTQFSAGKSGGEKYIDKDSGSIVMEIKSLDDMEKAERFFPGLFVSDQIPDRFHFDTLTITKSGKDLYYAVYIYFDDQKQMLSVSHQIIPKEGMSMAIIGITKEIKTKDGTIYISEDPYGDGANAGSYVTEDVAVDVAGMVTTDEILKILNQAE